MTLGSLVKKVAFAQLCFIVCLSIEAQAGTVQIGCATPKRPVHIYYADPVNGSMNGDGSAARPWSTLSAIVSANLINGQDKTSGVVHAGDVIYLLSGNHGAVYLDPHHGSGKYANTEYITIQAAPGNVTSETSGVCFT